MFESHPIFVRVALLCLLALPSLSTAPSAAGERISDPEGTLMAVHYSSVQELERLGSRLDVWAVDRQAGIATVYLRPSELEELRAEGFRMEPISDPYLLRSVDPAPGEAAPLDPRFYHYDDFVTNSRNRYLVRLYSLIDSVAPELAEIIDIGAAWEGTDGGHERRLVVVRVSNEAPEFGPIEDKPAFFLFANIHAREVATPELALRYLRYLLIGHRGFGGYGIDADATWLVDHHVAYILVMVNPDGHAVNEGDIAANRRKNLDDFNGCGNPSSVGVDLNRNHSFLWNCCGGSDGDPCSATYRGAAPASEPETQAFQSYFASVMDDQNGPNGDETIPDAAPEDTTGIFISLHSYGDLVLWPWNFPGFGLAPNDAGLKRIGRKFSFYNGYAADDGDIGYPVDGASDDWVYGKFGIPAYTFEVGSGGGACGGFFPAFGCIDGSESRDFWTENGPAFRYAHKIAATPYRTSLGPDAFRVSVEGTDLTTTFEDRRIAGETERDILGAEYFIDAPGAEGAGISLLPADGGWGEAREIGLASIDVDGLPTGRHYVLVRGRSSSGWGPFTAAWFEVD